MAAVREPGKGVLPGLAAQRLFGADAIGDVLGHARDPSSRTVGRGDASVYVEPPLASRDRLHPAAKGEAAVARAARFEGGARTGPVVEVHVLEEQVGGRCDGAGLVVEQSVLLVGPDRRALVQIELPAPD